jgi:excisionase family DNA binding protein
VHLVNIMAAGNSGRFILVVHSPFLYYTEVKMDINPLLTASDVARRLQISRALAYRLITDGKLCGIRFGRTVRVSEEALIAFIQQNITTSHGDANNQQWR